MKKMEIFLLLLLVGLAGCCRKRCEPVCCDTPVEECSSQNHNNEVVGFDNEFGDDEESVRSFFNEETGEFEADLEEWVFADDLDFPMPVMAENDEEEENKPVEVAAADWDNGLEAEKKSLNATAQV